MLERPKYVILCGINILGLKVMKVFWISLIIGLVVGSLGYWFVSINTHESQSMIATIIYTDTGFYPATTTVAKGATVTWVNDSSKELWIGSGHHPIHDEYPEHQEGDCSGSHFDTCKGIPTGASWSFTIDLLGTWHYHNHLEDEDAGVIVVEPTE